MEGLVFQIRNEHGKQLYEILEGNSDSSWYWSIVPEKSYYSSSNNLNDFSHHYF